MVRGVSADLAETPGCCRFQVVFRLIHQSIFQGCDSFRHDHCHSQGIIKSRYVAEGHDAWEASVSFGLTDVVHRRCRPARIHYEFGQLRCVFRYLPNADGSLLPHQDVHILQAVEDSREDLSLNDYFCQVHCVLRDLGEAGAHLPLQLGVGVRDQGCQVRHCPLIHHCLSQLFGVLCYLTQSSGRDPLESELWLLDAKDQKAYCLGVHHCLSKLMGVLGDAGECPSCCLFN
mmetsp:Transcript_26295/g.25462  ORF Transcript_26295/g.25462 Transcript_26295/m.25462 type:complete len:231 (-) Transcript_26295:100-792(-)